MRESGEVDVPLISKEGVSFVTGNCFNIDIERAISSCRYDRIYVGEYSTLFFHIHLFTFLK